MKHTETLYSQWMKEPISLKRKSMLQRFGYVNAIVCAALVSLMIINICSLLTVY